MHVREAVETTALSLATETLVGVKWHRVSVSYSLEVVMQVVGIEAVKMVDMV